MYRLYTARNSVAAHLVARIIYRKPALLTRFFGTPPCSTRITSVQAFWRSAFWDRSVYQAQCGVMTTSSIDRSG